MERYKAYLMDAHYRISDVPPQAKRQYPFDVVRGKVEEKLGARPRPGRKGSRVMTFPFILHQKRARPVSPTMAMIVVVFLREGQYTYLSHDPSSLLTPQRLRQFQKLS